VRWPHVYHTHTILFIIPSRFPELNTTSYFHGEVFIFIFGETRHMLRNSNLLSKHPARALQYLIQNETSSWTQRLPHL